MRDLKPEIPSNAEFHICYTSPGGITLRPFADGYLLMRVTLGHIDHAEDGLLAEMKEDREPIPWASQSVREEALGNIKASNRLDAEIRDRLVSHILSTPHYD